MYYGRSLKSFCCWALASFVIAHLAVPAFAAQQDAQAPDIDRIARAVVRIVGVSSDGREMQSGSGTIVDPSGTIYTNRHVVAGADDFRIEVVQDLAEPPVAAYRATVVGYSPEVDFAELQIDRDVHGGPVHPADLPFLSSSASVVRHGHEILVYGFPTIGEDRLTHTEGIVSSIRNGTVGGRRVPVAYQTDAVVGSGSSGGLAVNMRGEMVGLPTAMHVGTGGGVLTDLLPLAAVDAARTSGLLSDLGQLADTARSLPSDTINHQLEATFGHVSLRRGFRLDSAWVIAGGLADVSYLGSSFRGYTAVAPDYRIELGGESPGVGIRFVADDPSADPTLVVRGPDGRFRFDDDGGLGLNPFVWLDTPTEGTYHVWAGTFDGTYADGVLLFTEDGMHSNSHDDGADDYGQLGPEPGPDLDDFGQLDYDASPSFGEVVLPEGFLRLRGVTAGGRVDVSHLGPRCWGSAAAAPVLRAWVEERLDLGIRFRTDGTDADPTLIIRGPDGRYTCADDGPEGLDPSMWVDAGPGSWNVWVGTYDRTNIEGTLTITATPSLGEGLSLR